MQTDTITRLLLVAILVCLVVLIFLNLGSNRAEPADAAAASPAPQADSASFRNQLGRTLEMSDLVALSQAVGNEALPSDMRVWAALQLQGVHHEQVTEALIPLLDDEDEVLSTAALQALAGHDDPRVREAALRGLEHDDEDVRIVSRYVLESIGVEVPPES